MSNEVFPSSLPGVDIKVQRTVMAPPVQVRTTPSQREYRARDATLPRYGYQLSFNVLRSDALAELQQVVGFFNRHGGEFDTFLIEDPADNTVTEAAFGIGNGSTAAYQLVRSFGNFAEPVYEFNGAPVIFRTDWQGKQQLYSTNRVFWNPYSEQLDQASQWTLVNATVSANAIAAPDGATTADKLVETTATGNHGVLGVATGDPLIGQFVTVSCFAKAAERSRIYLWLDNGSGLGVTMEFNLAAQTATLRRHNSSAWAAPTPQIVSMGNGWYRCMLYAQNLTESVAQLRVYLGDGAASLDIYGTPTYAGTAGSGAYIWGLNLSDAGFTSYFKTVATSASEPDYSITATGLVTFTVPPVSGAALAWSGSYYRRVRFAIGQAEMERFLKDLWSWRQCRFISTNT